MRSRFSSFPFFVQAHRVAAQLWRAEGQTFIALSPCVYIPNFLSVHPGFLSQRPFPATLVNLQEKSRWFLGKAFLGLQCSLPHSLFTRTLGGNLNVLWRAAGTQGLASPAISRRFFRLTRETLEGNPSGSEVHPFYGHVLGYCGESPMRIFGIQEATALLFLFKRQTRASEFITAA